MSWGCNEPLRIPTDADIKGSLHVGGNTNLDGPVNIKGPTIITGPCSTSQLLCQDFAYKGIPLDYYISQVSSKASPLFTYPNITTSTLCSSIATHYFSNTPNYTKLSEILVTWFYLQTQYLSKEMNKVQSACISLLLWTLPQTQLLIDGDNGYVRKELNKKIHTQFNRITSDPTVANILIGSYGALRCLVEGFITDDENYKKIYMKKLIGILCAMHEDFPDSIRMDEKWIQSDM